MTECSPPTMCHMSGVRCQVSGVRCQVSQGIYLIFIIFLLSGEARRWRVCYQRGLPRLVSVNGIFYLSFKLSILVGVVLSSFQSVQSHLVLVFPRGQCAHTILDDPGLQLAATLPSSPRRPKIPQFACLQHPDYEDGPDGINTANGSVT